MLPYVILHMGISVDGRIDRGGGTDNLSLEPVGTSLDDMVQTNLYLRNIDDFRPAGDVFFKYIKNGFPARMTTTMESVDSSCLCMLDGIAYKKGIGK